MTLWDGRFESAPGTVLWDYTADLSDRRLLPDDIDGSIAHVTMLGTTGVIAAEDARAIIDGLESLRSEVERGEFTFLEGDEDVHSAVERRLGEIVGPVAGKLHTGRSRNDQVALDLRLYLRRAAAQRVGQLEQFSLHLCSLAEANAAVPVPSYTHLQQAQASTLGHHLLAYAWMAMRSAERFSQATVRIDVSPLGAGASSGTSLGIDPDESARLLGMGGVFENSLDAVGSRDHVAEYVFCCAQAMVDLSRLAEEVVLWTSTEFGWARLADSVSTGSSALPHKRNPDIAELVRGRSARVAGDLTAVITLQKGLPLSYNRDLQEDKGLVFDADDVLASSLLAMTEMLGHIVFDPPPPEGETASLDLAEALVRRGVPFREAHQTVGRLIVALEAGGRSLAEANFDDLRSVHGSFEEADLAVVDVERSVKGERSPGSGTANSVHRQVAAIRARIGADPN
ncbi:MAG: argininosuccinate lyase [Acidimicrobiia bacterium]